MLKVSIQGQPASYHDIAQKKFFSEDTELTSRDSFKDVFADLENDKVDFGVVAIENSLYGSIYQVYDLLLKTHCSIVGEVYLRIEHCLIGLPECKLENVTSVFSQREAIAQCERWLEEQLPEAEIHETHDTAGSVAFVKAQADASQVAIASKEAAKLHGLNIVAKGIETNQKNYTRFIVIAKNAKANEKSDKTSIALRTTHKAGALYDVLGRFKTANINLTKLESRPIEGRPWEYSFYLDFEKSTQNEAVNDLLAQLDKDGHYVQLLGSYKTAEMPL